MVQGLVKAAQYNGMSGIIIDVFPDTTRARVMLDNGSDIGVALDRLTPIQPAGETEFSIKLDRYRKHLEQSQEKEDIPEMLDIFTRAHKWQIGSRVLVHGLLGIAARYNGKSGEITRVSGLSYRPDDKWEDDDVRLGRVGVTLDDGTEIIVKLENLKPMGLMGSKHVRELEVGMTVIQEDGRRSVIKQFLPNDMVMVDRTINFRMSFGRNPPELLEKVEKKKLKAAPEPRWDIATLVDDDPALIGQELIKLKLGCIEDLNGIEFLTSVTSLNLSSNKITSLVGIVFPPSLVSLNLSVNEITSLVGGVFPPSLVSLNVSWNQITSLGELVLTRLTSLKELDLSNNKLIDTSILKDTFKNVTHMMGSWNEGLPDEVVGKIMSSFMINFASLQSLETLKLHNNFFSTLKGDRFPCSLKTLQLGNNRIELIERIQILTNLTHLYLERNPIASLDRVELPSSLVVFELDAKNVTSLTHFQCPSSLLPSLRFNSDVLSKYETRYSHRDSNKSMVGIPTTSFLPVIHVPPLSPGPGPPPPLPPSRPGPSAQEMAALKPSLERDKRYRTLSNRLGGNKNKTKRRQRQRQNKRNKMQRKTKNKYSHRRRNAKSRYK
jgi:Leucine-rich repeat (LRR) protein